jgi:hypothetical protein
MVQIGYILKRLLDLKESQERSGRTGKWFEPGSEAFQSKFVVNNTLFPWLARVGPEG